jgi:diguanylate cyclase (GGDEF)-like protein
MSEKEIELIINKFEIFEKMYNMIRLVDPVNKKVIKYENNKSEESEFTCHDFWEKNKVCENCISIRSYNDNKIYVKIENNKNDIYMVTSIPVELNGRRVVVEVLKNVTDSIFVENMDSRNSPEILSVIESFNNLASKDPVVGIFNRRYINERLPVDILSTSLSGQSLSVIIADIDHFKNVNDTYGHLAGDHALKCFAETINGCLKRDSDWAARYGGEEFLISLPGAEAGTAKEIAEVMREKVEDMKIEFNGFKFGMTSSFGIFTAGPDVGMTADEIIGCADEKLYAAKNYGRNRVEA